MIKYPHSVVAVKNLGSESACWLGNDPLDKSHV